MEILFLIYLVAGYLAAGVVLYQNKIIIGKTGDLFFRKLVWGALFGFVLIPVAVFKKVFHIN